jgi:catechol 2,3-dioxygenase-like lactoylglutathione lyase family enzyme
MITGMSHVGVSVVDLERSIAFYRDLLGMSLIQQVPMTGPNYDAIMGKDCGSEDGESRTRIAGVQASAATTR